MKEKNSRVAPVFAMQRVGPYKVPQELDENTLYREFGRDNETKEGPYQCPLCSFRGVGSNGRILCHAAETHAGVSRWVEMTRLAINIDAKKNRADLLAKLPSLEKSATHPVRGSPMWQNDIIKEFQASMAKGVIEGGQPLSLGEACEPWIQAGCVRRTRP